MPRLPSPGRTAKSHLVRQCERCDSDRFAPIYRTAPRGAESEWMKPASGPICLSRSDHRDLESPEPLVASAASPNIPLKLAERSC